MAPTGEGLAELSATLDTAKPRYAEPTGDGLEETPASLTAGKVRDGEFCTGDGLEETDDFPKTWNI